MKKSLLLLLLLAALGKAHGQFVFNPKDYRIRQTVQVNAGKTEENRSLNRVNKADDKVFESITQNDLKNKKVKSLYGEINSSALVVSTEIDNFKTFYNSRSIKRGWRAELRKAGINLSILTSANTTFISNNTTSRRSTKGISAQALAGIYQKFDNAEGNNANNFFELGSRLSDLRLKLYTRVTYDLKEGQSKGQYILTRNQRSRFLYLDVISRGLLALDSLSTTVNEYVNTLQGSPFSLRIAHQINLSNPALVLATGDPEPEFFINLSLDARLIPIALGKEITSAGGSFHFIPSFTASFPAGKGDDATENDKFVIQLTANGAVLTSNTSDVLYLGQEKIKHYSLSFEGRAGLYSTEHPERNFNILFKYNLQEVNGSRASIGFTFAPQVT